MIQPSVATGARYIVVGHKACEERVNAGEETFTTGIAHVFGPTDCAFVRETNAILQTFNKLIKRSQAVLGIGFLESIAIRIKTRWLGRFRWSLVGHLL